MTALHLQPVPDETCHEVRVPPVFLVLQRANGHWSPGAKVVHVTRDEEDAEAYALHHKRLHPQQAFGVFMLRSEAREVENPVEIVRMTE